MGDTSAEGEKVTENTDKMAAQLVVSLALATRANFQTSPFYSNL